MTVLQRTPRPFTNAEFEKLVRAGGFGDVRVELRRGAIVKMSPQYVPHAAVKTALAKALETALTSAGLEWEVYQEVSVSFGSGFEPLPDIVVWDPSAAPAKLEGPVPAEAVKLIVEIAETTLADDLGEKLEDYARGNLPEYWVADVKGRLILRHAGPQENGYARREPSRFGETASSLVYPSVAVDTAKLR